MEWGEFTDWWLTSAARTLRAEWCALGVRGGNPSERIVDPEALIAATWSVGRADGRLFDGGLQWCIANADLLDRTRLKSVLPELDPVTGTVGRAWWDYIDGLGATPADEEDALPFVVPLVWRPGGSDFVQPRDQTFAARGLARAEFESDPGRLGELPLAARNSARLVLRGLLGASARAEVALAIGTNGPVDTAVLERRTLYSRRSIQVAIRQLQRVGLVSRVRTQFVPTPALRETLAPSVGDAVLADSWLRARVYDTWWTTTWDFEHQFDPEHLQRLMIRGAVEQVDELMLAHGLYERPAVPNDADIPALLDVAAAQVDAVS